MKKLYAERDPEALDVAGGFYGRHVSAMTAEGLHEKADIAAELAYRDMLLAAERERSARLARVARAAKARHGVREIDPDYYARLNEYHAALSAAAADLEVTK